MHPHAYTELISFKPQGFMYMLIWSTISIFKPLLKWINKIQKPRDRDDVQKALCGKRLLSFNISDDEVVVELLFFLFLDKNIKIYIYIYMYVCMYVFWADGLLNEKQRNYAQGEDQLWLL